MADTSDLVDWRELREFTAIDLMKSYVLSWRADGKSLQVDVDLYLTSDHPFFEAPRPAEKVCFRPCVIEFPLCESIKFGDSNGSKHIGETADQLGLGAITGLRRLNDGPFVIEGDFGKVQIDSERPILRFDTKG